VRLFVVQYFSRSVFYSAHRILGFTFYLVGLTFSFPLGVTRYFADACYVD